jgi:hypothetical protein
MAEVFDLLKSVILIYLKIVFCQSGNQRIVMVHNGRAQNYKICIYPDCVVIA